MMKNFKYPIAVLIIIVVTTMLSYAELNEAEKRVVSYMNYLQEMSYTAEYTEGLAKEDVESYLAENISFISDAFKITPNNIHWLMVHKNSDVALPETYISPTMPTDEKLIDLNQKMKDSVARYSEKMPSISDGSRQQDEGNE